MQPGVADLHPIFPARKLKRKWRREELKSQAHRDEQVIKQCPAKKAEAIWKTLLTKYPPVNFWSHAVTCPALHQVMDNGYILPCPADFVIHLDGDGNFEWKSTMQFYGDRYITAHVPEQTRGMRNLVSENQTKDVLDYTIKMETPWRIQAHKDIVFIQIPVPYWEEDRFSIATGIVDPRYSYEVNMQMFWHKLEPGEYIIKAGTPLAQWIPVNRDFLTSKAFDVVIETANKDDLDNNAIMEYNRGKDLFGNSTLGERIESNAEILKLNKNNERFN
tara:strand:- start:411 stop:1235 length:825 start_codon:yes stop_codon:yes gene_type:complete